MSFQVLITTTSELFVSALEASRELSTRILKLADLSATPLTPGETADSRRHQIAKLGKSLAEAFLTIDKLMRAISEAHERENDVTAGPVSASKTDIDPNAN